MQTLRNPREELGKETREAVVVSFWIGVEMTKETLMREGVDEEEELEEGRRLDMGQGDEIGKERNGKTGPD